MYYFVREKCGHRDYVSPVSNEHRATSLSDTGGFTKELEFCSEIIEGKISIDGQMTLPISLGETFSVKTLPEY